MSKKPSASLRDDSSGVSKASEEDEKDSSSDIKASIMFETIGEVNDFVVTPITSSAIAEIQYSKKFEILGVTFHPDKGGGHPFYKDVPPDTVQRLIDAGSPGAFFNQNIRDFFNVLN